MDTLIKKIADIIGLPYLGESSNERTRELMFDAGIPCRFTHDAMGRRTSSVLLDEYNSKVPQLKEIPEFHFIAAGYHCNHNTYIISVYMDPVKA